MNAIALLMIAVAMPAQTPPADAAARDDAPMQVVPPAKDALGEPVLGPLPISPADPTKKIKPFKGTLPTKERAPIARAIAFKLGEIDKDEEAALQRYLVDLIGKPATRAVLDEAETRLAALRRYERARCSVYGNGSIVCDIWRARVLREVTVEGLPVAILETDLMKRVFLRPGEPLDEEEALAKDRAEQEQAQSDDADDGSSTARTRERAGTTRLLRQRQRIEDFLEREGFIGAEVRLLVKKAGTQGEHDVVIRVRGGSFVHVRRVELASFGPLSQRELRDAFGRMCFTTEGILDGVFLNNWTSCFNKRRLQATVDRFTRELHNLGYPEGRVRAEPVFIDAARTDDEECADTPLDVERFEENGLKPPPHCVDITVTVDAGPKVLVRFHVDKDAERPIVESSGFLGGTALWLRDTFFEPFSRFAQIASGAPVSSAIDTELIDERLKERVTFEEAGAVDETEIGVTARNAEAYLAERGRVDPHVTVDERTWGNERVIDFFVTPSPIGAVSSVEIVGNRRVTTKDIFDNVELSARPRGFQTSGALSYNLLLDDEQRLRELYADRGFPEATVQGIAAMNAQGDIRVTFVVEEGEPFVLAGLVLAGGVDSLEKDVVRAIRHCQGGLASLERRDPVVVEDCVGSPLRPEELDADAQRVQTVYASRGYPNVEAAVETSFSPEGAVLRITVVPSNATEEQRAHPKPNNVTQVVLGEVFLEGNRRTRREVILREAGLDGKSGQPLDPIALGKGISRLRRTGLYDSVELEYLGLESGSGNAHLRLAFSERPAFTLDTSLGFSTEQLLSLRAELRHKNLFGSMLDASLLVDMGLFIGRFSQVRTQLRWPRIVGTDITASLVPIAVSYLDEPAGARLKVPSTPAGQAGAAAWEQPDLRRRLFTVGGSVSLDWRLQDISPIVDDKLTLGLAFELRNDWLNLAAQPISPFSGEALETIDGLLTAFDVERTPIGTITPRLSYNDIDNPFDPKSGFGFDLFVRASTPPLVKYGPSAVVGTSARGYLTFFDRLTLAGGVRTRFGYSAAVDACPDPGCEWALMQNDLLLLGGERSVRGVAQNTIGVLGPLYDEQLVPVIAEGTDTTAFQLRPGLYSGNVNVELRYSLIRQLFIGELKPAVFFDAGVSTDDFNHLGDVADLRSAWSVGAGLRYVLPVGPLSFDFGYSPPRKSWAFYVSLGYAF